MALLVQLASYIIMNFEPACYFREPEACFGQFFDLNEKTELANEVAVCGTCHALVHAGLLRVSGQADGELCWEPVGAAARAAAASSSAVPERT